MIKVALTADAPAAGQREEEKEKRIPTEAFLAGLTGKKLSCLHRKGPGKTQIWLNEINTSSHSSPLKHTAGPRQIIDSIGTFCGLQFTPQSSCTMQKRSPLL